MKLVCAARMAPCLYACSEHTGIRTILSSVFKLGLACVISEYLTICRHSRRPDRDLDSTAAAKSAHCVCAGTQSEICNGLHSSFNTELLL